MTSAAPISVKMCIRDRNYEEEQEEPESYQEYEENYQEDGSEQ